MTTGKPTSRSLEVVPDKTPLPSVAQPHEITTIDLNGDALTKVSQRSLDEADFARRTSPFWVWSSFLLLVIGPAILVGWYLSERATPRYTSEFRIAVRSLDVPTPTSSEGLLGLAGFGAPVANESHALVQFLESRAALDLIDADPELSFDKIFANPETDGFSVIKEDAPIETRVSHWNRFVDVRFEATINTVIVEVTTFKAIDTLAIGQLLLRKSDLFVNELSQLSRLDSLSFAKAELETAEERLTRSRLAFSIFQEEEKILDPKETAISALAIISQLRQDLTQQRMLLAEQRVDLEEDSRIIKKTLGRIDILEKEIADIRSEATVRSFREDENGRPISQVLLDYAKLTTDAQFAELSYQSALVSLESARIEADRRKMFLSTIVAPSLPEKPSWPNPLKGFLTTFAIALALWLVALVGQQTIREHA